MPDDWERLLYTPYNYARMIKSRDMRASESDEFLQWAFQNEKYWMLPAYRNDFKKLKYATAQYLSYLNGMRNYKNEAGSMEEELAEIGIDSHVEEFLSLAKDPHHLLKAARVRMLLFNKTRSVQVSMRKLMGQYGYKRRKLGMVSRVNLALHRLGLVAMVGGKKCDLMVVPLDKPITLRLWDDVYGGKH